MAALMLVGPLAFARGPQRRHGPQQVGRFGDGALSVAVAQV